MTSQVQFGVSQLPSLHSEWFMITTMKKFTNASSYTVTETHLPGDLRVGISSPILNIP